MAINLVEEKYLASLDKVLKGIDPTRITSFKTLWSKN